MSAMDDIRNQIKIRGLKQGGFNDPVQEFTGKFDGFDVVEAEFQGQKSGRNNIELKFSEIEVIKSSEPFPFPNKKVVIGYSESNDSRWGIFAGSLVKHLDSTQDLGSSVGKRLHLAQHTHTIYQGKEKGKAPAECWEVESVEGGVSSNSTAKQALSTDQQLLLLLNGRTQQQFNMEALRLDAVKQDSVVLGALLNNTWIAAQEAQGLIKKDESGVYTLAIAS